MLARDNIRRTGFDARFIYESRLFYPYYGQFRYATNPAGAAFKAWAADNALRYLGANPLADGLFVDNSSGRFPLPGANVTETTTADVLQAVSATSYTFSFAPITNADELISISNGNVVDPEGSSTFKLQVHYTDGTLLDLASHVFNVGFELFDF